MRQQGGPLLTHRRVATVSLTGAHCPLRDSDLRMVYLNDENSNYIYIAHGIQTSTGFPGNIEMFPLVMNFNCNDYLYGNNAVVSFPRG